jgi:hypothetical protein
MLNKVILSDEISLPVSIRLLPHNFFYFSTAPGPAEKEEKELAIRS